MSRFPSGRAARVAMAALGSAAAIGATAGPASATTIRGGGNLVAPGSVVRATLTGSATLSGTATTCTAGSFSATVGTNPAIAVPLTPTAFTLSSCTAPVTGVTLNTAGPSSVTYSSPLGGGQAAVRVGMSLRLAFTPPPPLPPSSCIFSVDNPESAASALFTNAPNRLAFTMVPLRSSGLCALSAGTLTASFSTLTVLSVPPSPPAGSAVVGSVVTVTP